MKFDEYTGQTVFITGGASGIGKAQAVCFLKNGANVFVFDKAKKNLAEMEEQYSGQFTYAIGNVTDKASVQRAVQYALHKFKRIDILLNTAGILDGYVTTLETEEWLWDKVMDTNVKGTYLVTNFVLPYMLQQESGVIINMSSIAGFVAGGGGAAYTASKHAIIGYTKQLDYDYCRKGIRANAIAPGAIKTPMNKADFSGDGKIAEWVANQTPAGRWADPIEVGELTLFLASRAADYMHGVVIPIDGGWTNK
ncbi:3-oxoacyl-ACP reductase [Virgibacillus sp. Bac330]|uniref:3-oxoacyl-ACP reductase n=1 Tax=Virgibacillus sp. Bac330 TaxID=2419841 RepID=UPI000EF43FD4|nr:3-oxoacyl-ACP reductase [Virgibacillus sp. Bac330]